MISNEIRRFNATYLRQRNKIERKGIRLAQAALIAQIQPLIDNIDTISLTDLDSTLNLINDKPILSFFAKYYPMSADLALMQRNFMLRGKKADLEDEFYKDQFSTYLYQFATTEQLEIISTITETSRSRALKIIQDSLELGETNGWGVRKVRDEILKGCKDYLKGNAKARSATIAQTELLKASNAANMRAAESTGFQFKKYWLATHDGRTRPTHAAAEQESIQRNGLRQDERFNSTGLLYPGDPTGDVSEIVNCRCTVLNDIV